jgi:hypothetical protein
VRRAVVLASVLGALLLSRPALAGEDDPWEGSAITSPEADEADLTTPDPTFEGSFTHAGSGPPDRIFEVDVRFTVESPPNYTLAEGCAVPDMVVITPEPPPPGEAHVVPFSVPTTWPCNGRYAVTATASAGDVPTPDTKELTRPFVLRVPPPAVTVASSSVSPERVTTLTWEAPATLPPDFLGYIVERRDPGADGYHLVAALNALTVQDPLAADGGEYVYRVRTLRAAPDRNVLAAAEDSATTAVTAEAAPDTTSPTSGVSIGSGGVTIPRGPGITLPGAPTVGTIDPGFGATLDYDGAIVPELETGELPTEYGAEEGATEEAVLPGPGLAVPLAGAMLLSVWAAWLLYVNRLASRSAPLAAPHVVDTTAEHGA